MSPLLRLDRLAERRCYFCSTDAFWWAGWAELDGELACRDCCQLRETGGADGFHLFARSWSTYRARKGSREFLHGAQYDLYYKLVDFKNGAAGFGVFVDPLGRELATSVNELLTAEEIEPELSDAPVIIVPAPCYCEGREPPRDHVARLLAAATPHLTEGAEVRTDVLRKVKDIHQRGASRDERIQQNRGAYQAISSKKLRGSIVVVADDFYTTGTTLLACSTALVNAGALRVYGASIARVIGADSGFALFHHEGKMRIGSWQGMDDDSVISASAEHEALYLRFGCTDCPANVASEALSLPANRVLTNKTRCTKCHARYRIKLEIAGKGDTRIVRPSIDGRRRSEIEYFLSES